MVSNITPSGDLTPPKSVAAALRRVKDLRREIQRIDLQLVNPARPARLGSAAAYDAWRKRADGARRLFRKELQLTEDWVAERAKTAGAVELLGRAREILEDVELEPEEEALAREIDQLLDGGG